MEERVTLLLLRTESPEGMRHPQEGRKPHTSSAGRDIRACSPSSMHREETEAQRGKATCPRSHSKLTQNQPRINERDTVSYSFVFLPAQPSREQLDS